MYKITQWDSRYEVNSSGDPYKPGSKQGIRSTSLLYVRAKVHGRQLGTGMRKLQAIAGDRHNEVFGLFMRFLEIAGDAGRGRRGHLLNSDDLDDPATPKDLAFILNSPQDQIEYALTKLIEVGWISGDSGKRPELPETPGTSGNSGEIPSLNNETETESNRSELNETEPEKLTGGSVDKDEEVVSKDDGEDSDLIIKDDSDSDSEVTATNNQSFLLRLLMILPRWSKSDKTCFRNLAKMLAGMVDAPNTFGEALVIAKECRKNGGENPKQAFMFRVQEHFGIKLTTEWRCKEAKREQTKKDAKIK